MTNLRSLALVVALLAPGIAAAQPAACPQFFPNGQPPTLLNLRLNGRVTLLCNNSFAVVASGLTHGALWSAEHPTARSLAAARRTAREGDFHAEDRLPAADRAQLDDYRRSGFDRGHMTPSGDMPTREAQQESFSLANIVPQAGPLNRGVWEGIESAVRDLAVQEGALYVVTGVAFQGANIQSIGTNGVLVPTSTWKAVYDPRTGGAGVYVCTNTAEPSCHTTSVAQLSGAVGIDPFPALPARVKQVAMQLPPPKDSHYAAASHRGRRPRPYSLFDRNLGY